MRYEPHKDEYAAVPTMTDDELLEYFLYRAFETDEVWTLRDGPQAVTRESGGRESLPVWPYQGFAEEAAVGEWSELKAVADSVEFFAYQTLNKIARQGLAVEVMPRRDRPGCLISPQRLFGILENMMEARDYSVGD
ncbi:DUF2750 domain-containing protein [Methylomonas sp. MgM2]